MDGQGPVLGLTGDGQVRAHLRDERGSNAVELALVLPILVAIVLGLLWGGLALNTRMTVTQVAREGARYGATVPFPTNTTPATEWTSWLDQVENRLSSTADGQLNGGFTACIRVYEASDLRASRAVNGSTACPGSTVATGTTATESRVEIDVQSSARFDFYWGGGSLPLTSNAISRHEGAGSP